VKLLGEFNTRQMGVGSPPQRQEVQQQQQQSSKPDGKP